MFIFQFPMCFFQCILFLWDEFLRTWKFFFRKVHNLGHILSIYLTIISLTVEELLSLLWQNYHCYSVMVEKIIRKNGPKNEKCQNFEKIFFRQFKRCDDMSMFGWKHVPQKCFQDLIMLTNLLLVKFRRLVKRWRFLTHFLPSTKIFACLVNKCWPIFCKEKKPLPFLYKTLTLDFSCLS